MLKQTRPPDSFLTTVSQKCYTLQAVVLGTQPATNGSSLKVQLSQLVQVRVGKLLSVEDKVYNFDIDVNGFDNIWRGPLAGPSPCLQELSHLRN